MTDIAERLNLESAKLVKVETQESNQDRKAKRAEEKALKKKQAEPTSPSAMELTQQLFGVPQLGFSVQEEREKAIPIFDPFLMGENAQRFLKALDPVVEIYEYFFSILTLERPRDSFFILLLLSNVNICFE
jgi:hypothetical protein